jgi:hypothetical protein
MANILKARTYTERPLTDQQFLSYFSEGTTGSCAHRRVEHGGQHSMSCDLRTPFCPTRQSIDDRYPGLVSFQCYPNRRYPRKHMRISLKLLSECDGSNLSQLIADNHVWVKGVIKNAFQHEIGISAVHNIRIYPKSLKASLDISNVGTPPAVADLRDALENWEDGKVDGWMEGDITFPSDGRFTLDMTITGTKPIKAKRGKRRATRRRRR